jgi:ABC-type bacteriocin/lantibiotic exporter with double-glycine peptidase domain
MASNPGLLKGYTAERIGLILNFITGVGIPLGISFYYSWKLTLVVAVFMPVALIWGFMQGQVIRSNKKLSGNYKIDDAVQCASESIQNIHTVMINNLQVYFQKQLEIRFSSNLRRMTTIIFIESIFYGIGYVLFFFVQCTAFSFGAVLMKNGEVEGFNIVRIFASILFSSLFLGKTISTLTDIPRAKAAAKWYFRVVDDFDDGDDLNNSDQNAGLMLNNFQGNIKFENVKFCYMSRPDQITLRNVNLEFKNNESSAIVGASGCGKSTIMSMILKFYAPYSGRILIDGIDIKDVNTRWLRKQCGLVSQEFNLFDGTIAENITYGLEKNEVPVLKLSWKTT